MIFTTLRNRRVAQVENEFVRVSVTVEGGHIAEILEKASGVNPLWVPPWDSIEPSAYSAEEFPEYGNDAESRLLAGIMGHNLCLDLFGAPSADEAAAGLGVHGEAGVVVWTFEESDSGLIARCVLPGAQIAFERRIRLVARRVEIQERVTNVSIYDRPIAWTEHVTLGPPFLERGRTEFQSSIEGRAGQTEVFTSAESSSTYSANRLDSSADEAFFSARSPSSGVTLRYVWKRRDFPWLGIWEENHSREFAPWNGRTVTRGMEFGVSPYPESRRAMIERGEFLWLGAGKTVEVAYCCEILG